MINPCSGVKNNLISWRNVFNLTVFSPKSCHHRNYIANYHCRRLSKSHPVSGMPGAPHMLWILFPPSARLTKLNLTSRASIHNCPFDQTHIWTRWSFYGYVVQAFCPGPEVKVALSGNSHVFAIGNEQCYEVHRPLPAPSLSSFCPVCRPVDGSHISSHLRRLWS